MGLLKNNEELNKRAVNILAKKHIYTYNDLASFIPRKYIDYREIKNVTKCEINSNAVVTGTLKNVLSKKNVVGKKYVTAQILQEDGIKISILYFNLDFIYQYLLKFEGIKVCAGGKVCYSEEYGYSLSNPDFIIPASEFVPKIKSVYTKFSGISENMLRKMINYSLTKLEEPLEEEIIKRDKICNYQEALHKLHEPSDIKDYQLGLARIIHDDLLYFALNIFKNRDDENTFIPVTDTTETVKFTNTLPFELTKDQKDVLNTFIVNSKIKRNNILLQGDVGSGKTIVAATCMLLMAENDFQSVLIAPRGVLAKQHYEEIATYSQKMGKKCVFLHSGLKSKEKKEILEEIKNGTANLIVGTHSCLSDCVEYKNLALVITDEEHLFGVKQKEALDRKALKGYHYISMSATPIPRSIAEIIYGDSKDILTIKTKPAGRKPIKTKIIQNRESVFNFISQEIANKHKCYVVCPAIDENEDFPIRSIEEVKQYYEKFFGKEHVGIINGKMKDDEIAQVMEDFIHGNINILISTTVIEVGVNVPAATVMIIEQADRFGLASLHQLRGRVGRSDAQSYCFLISEDSFSERLKTLEMTNDGFKIAQADLLQRGGGNLIGIEQSGHEKILGEVIKYPEFYKEIKETAKFCIANGYGKKLLELRAEHEAAENAN